MNAFDIPVAGELPVDLASRYDVLVDAIFGFSFKGDIRAPFDTVLKVHKRILMRGRYGTITRCAPEALSYELRAANQREPPASGFAGHSLGLGRGRGQ